MTNVLHLGYTTLNEEITVDRLPVEGTIPAWLEGSLLRNGPAKFDVGPDTFRHWFDGFAMLHRFTFQNGNVSYANKFLQSDAYQSAMKEGRITFSQFATDPYKGLFKGTMSEVVNANVSINKVAGEFVAMTETPLPVAFDPHTLDTLGVVRFDDDITGHHGSAHPHYDFVQRMSVSYLTEFNRQSRLKVYAIKDGEQQRRLIGSYPVLEPSYIHSFGLTEQYVVIAEFPYRVNPLNLLTRGKPFIENFEWRPQEGTTFIVMSKQDGSVVGRYESEAFFSFHHINAFERNGEILLDISTYPDASAVSDLYLEKVKGNAGDNSTVARNETRRYSLPLHGSSVRYEHLSEYGIELPTINYRRSNTHDYGVAYGVGSDTRHPEDFTNLLIRIDVLVNKVKSARVLRRT